MKVLTINRVLEIFCVKFDNKDKLCYLMFQIKTVPIAREVMAIYTVDEAQVDLLISLPANYPLGGLEVQSNKQIGGTSHKQWLLQFKKCVLHQVSIFRLKNLILLTDKANFYH